MKRSLVLIAASTLAGCATLTEDAMTPIAMSFSDGSAGTCDLTNKRGAWQAHLPTTIAVRKSDDALKYDCQTIDGRGAVGAIESEMGGKIIASAVFIDFGITDAITDKHRRYAASFVIPVQPREGTELESQRGDVYSELERLDDLRQKGILSDAEFEAEKAKLIGGGS